VRLEGRDPGQGRLGGARLADHGDVGLGLQQVVHPPADDLVIIEQEYGDLPAIAARLVHLLSSPARRRWPAASPSLSTIASPARRPQGPSSRPWPRKSRNESPCRRSDAPLIRLS